MIIIKQRGNLQFVATAEKSNTLPSLVSARSPYLSASILIALVTLTAYRKAPLDDYVYKC